MNEEELKLLNKLDDLPNKLNLEIRGLILAEVMLRKENQELKNQQKEFIEWLKEKSYQTHFQLQTALIYEKVLSKYKEIMGGDNK